MTPHRSDNRLHWQPPLPELQAARASNGWKTFHRECSRHGLFFDDVNRNARNQWSAVAYILRGDTKYTIARGSGRDPIAAVQSAFDAARESGHPIPHLSVAGIPVDELDDLIG